LKSTRIIFKYRIRCGRVELILPECLVKMAKNEISNESLDEMFKRGLNIHEDLENCEETQNSETFQHKVKKGILILEDATRLVSLLDIFSQNETVSEVQTEHLKFFLLPVLLGDLNSKITGGDSDRLETIKIVETYYEDFLQRVKDYGIASIPNLKQDQTKPDKKPNVAQMNREREEKIRRYKESKEIEASLKELKNAIANPSCDEDILRNYFLKLIRKFVISALDEIMSFKTEKEILQHMAKMRDQSGAGAVVVAQPSQRPKRPLKPIIITRDAIQKEIFGMGYKNIPVMSIEEFYEKRAQDGWYDKPALPQNYTIGAEGPPTEDDEAAVNDAKEDNDDPEELARKREFDEYKDEHKRGEGNRHNRG